MGRVVWDPVTNRFTEGRDIENRSTASLLAREAALLAELEACRRELQRLRAIIDGQAAELRVLDNSGQLAQQMGRAFVYRQ